MIPPEPDRHAIPTDDEAATVLAGHAEKPSGYFLQPSIQPRLPRQLASKHELCRLCCQHGVPAPPTVHLASPAGVASFASHAAFPELKNAEPWVRRRAPLVVGTVPNPLLANMARRIVVEQVDLPARLAYRSSTGGAPLARHAASTELAWAARDDPVPLLAMCPRLSRPLMSALARETPER